MEVHFQINYCTVWGEEVNVKIVQKNGVESIHPLSTTDGKVWNGTVSISGDIFYQYCICNDGRFVRSEWEINKRSIHGIKRGNTVFVFDAWRDKSEMSYFYSSAFTDCIRHESDTKQSATKSAEYTRSIILKVSVPQLTENQNIAITGNQDMLGQWDVNKGLTLQKENELLEWSIQLDASKLVFPLEYKFYATDKKTGDLIDWESSSNHVISRTELSDKTTYIYSDLVVRFARPAWKGAGVAIPIFSLKTKKSFGVGDFGDLKKMIDWAALTHQRVVQILPINDTTMTHSWTDSYPYSSISIYALHPMYLDLNALGKLSDEHKAAEFEAL